MLKKTVLGWMPVLIISKANPSASFHLPRVQRPRIREVKIVMSRVNPSLII
uniref:Uncharacterized protein n=1 Tax=Arundo donax TaxID=35708 RepID=A0A0A9HAF9_ARUDO